MGIFWWFNLGTNVPDNLSGAAAFRDTQAPFLSALQLPRLPT